MIQNQGDELEKKDIERIYIEGEKELEVLMGEAKNLADSIVSKQINQNE